MKYNLIKELRKEIYNIRKVLYDLILEPCETSLMLGVLSINISDCIFDIERLREDAIHVEDCHDDLDVLTDLQTIAEYIQEHLRQLKHE